MNHFVQPLPKLYWRDQSEDCFDLFIWFRSIQISEVYSMHYAQKLNRHGIVSPIRLAFAIKRNEDAIKLLDFKTDDISIIIFFLQKENLLPPSRHIACISQSLSGWLVKRHVMDDSKDYESIFRWLRLAHITCDRALVYAGMLLAVGIVTPWRLAWALSMDPDILCCSGFEEEDILFLRDFLEHEAIRVQSACFEWFDANPKVMPFFKK